MRPLVPSRPVFPACLLLQGRRCLVAGGGIVALRKVEHLLAAQAVVDIIAPRLCDDLLRLVEKEGLSHHARQVDVQEVQSYALVIAATDDGAVNRSLLAACQAQGIWCNAADKHWMEGDFVTPAVLRQQDLVVAISTGGRSCRRSRLVKENLARHIALSEQIELLVLGTSHHHLSQEAREHIQPDAQGIQSWADMLRQIWGIHEFQILATCNRIEIHALVARDSAIVELIRRIMGFDRLPSGSFYERHGLAAFAHVARVSAGLDAQSLGEEHIRGQIRAAQRQAAAASWSGSMLAEWMQASLQLGMLLRRATQPLLAAAEIEDHCLAYCCKKLPHIASLRVAVLGSGQIGHGIIKRFAELTSCVWLYHSRQPHLAPQLEDRVGCLPLSQLDQVLPQVDVVIAACAQGSILQKEHAPGLQGLSCIVDLGMPRNCSAALIQQLSEIYCDLDTLHAWQQEGGSDRQQVFALAESLISRETQRYQALLQRCLPDQSEAQA